MDVDKVTSSGLSQTVTFSVVDEVILRNGSWELGIELQ